MSSRQDLRPALAASVALHLAIVLAALIAMRNAPPVKMISVTPVTLVMSPGEANVRAAEQAAERQAAAAPDPSPEPPTPAPAETPPAAETPAPAEAPPEPQVEPAPAPPQPVHRRAHLAPAPAPIPEPIPAPVPRPHRAPPPPPHRSPPPRVAPQPKPKPTPALQPDLDLGALTKTSREQKLNLADLTRASHATDARTQKLNLADLTRTAPDPLNLSALAGGRRGSAARGAARAETDRQARQAAGAATALTGDQLGALQAKIIPLWHLDCNIQGASGVDIKVELKLTPDHRLASPPRVLAKKGSGASESVVDAAAQRALSAAAQGAPYTELPKNAPLDIALHFNARQACGA